MKLTLLDLVQNILSSLNSDEVNSFSDTTESKQVAEIVRTTYFNIIARANLPEHKKMFGLTPSMDITKPVLMTVPNTVNKIDWIKYNKSLTTSLQPSVTYPDFAYVTVLPIDQFMDMINSLNPNDNEIYGFDLYGFKFYYRDDKHPDYCCVIQDSNIVFDSYDSTVDSTLQESKTLCYGKMIPAFIMQDNFIPDLDEQQFPLLLNEAKSLASLELKQVGHELATLEARRQWRNMQHSKRTINVPSDFDQLPDFGRRGGNYGFSKPKLH